MEISVGNVFTVEELINVKEALNLNLTDSNNKLLMQGDTSEIVEVAGKKSKITLRRKNNGDMLAEIFHVKEAIEIPDRIEGHKLSRNEKKSLMDGGIVLLNTKDGAAYIQIDKELNMVIVKSSKDVGIPNVIGDNAKHNFKGYKLTNTDKELLANGHMLPPKVLCSRDGFILAEFGISDDKKGVKFAHVISIPKKDVNDYIEKYNVEKETNLTHYQSKEKDELHDSKDIIAQKELQNRTVNVLRNLDEEFLEALSVRNFERLNNLAKNDQYEPSKKTLEVAHLLPNLSDADKVAIKTIFPEKEKEPFLEQNEKKSVLEIVKDNKRAEVRVREAEEKGVKKETTYKVGSIVNQAFQNM